VTAAHLALVKVLLTWLYSRQDSRRDSRGTYMTVQRPLLTWPWLIAPAMIVVSPAGHAIAALPGLLAASPPGQNMPLPHSAHTPAALNAHPAAQSTSSSSSRCE
jgi:hypothetical protein